MENETLSAYADTLTEIEYHAVTLAVAGRSVDAIAAAGVPGLGTAAAVRRVLARPHVREVLRHARAEETERMLGAARDAVRKVFVAWESDLEAATTAQEREKIGRAILDGYEQILTVASLQPQISALASQVGGGGR